MGLFACCSIRKSNVLTYQEPQKIKFRTCGAQPGRLKQRGLGLPSLQPVGEFHEDRPVGKMGRGRCDTPRNPHAAARRGDRLLLRPVKGGSARTEEDE